MSDAVGTKPKLKKKDFSSDQDVRWCPGCGDYAILAQVQKVFPELGIPKEDFLVVSGIGCSSRFPYYMNTYGFHSIHGRAPAIASGANLQLLSSTSASGTKLTAVEFIQPSMK